MKKGNLAHSNVINLVSSYDKTESKTACNEPSMSDELQQAIQNLIYRLRELGPLSNN